MSKRIKTVWTLGLMALINAISWVSAKADGTCTCNITDGKTWSFFVTEAKNDQACYDYQDDSMVLSGKSMYVGSCEYEEFKPRNPAIPPLYNAGSGSGSGSGNYHS